MRLSVEGVSKSFRGGMALDNVHFDVRAGECHALAGHNGAGKSTLIRILAGAEQADKGDIRLDGLQHHFHTPYDAQKAGIFTIYQELSLIPGLSVAENIFLGDMPKKRTGTVDWSRARRDAREWLGNLGVKLDVEQPIKLLPLAHRQMVELAKAMRHSAKVILLDEPTASLQQRDTERLFEVLQGLQERGVGLIYISHRMDELERICQRVTVLRDGKKVGTYDLPQTPSSKIVESMAARVKPHHAERQPSPDRPGSRGVTQIGKDVVLAVDDIYDGEVLHGVSFELKRGEILAVTGRAGSGQSNIAQCLFGMRPTVAGSLRLNGQSMELRSPKQAVRAGIGLVPEERKSQGLVLGMSVLENITLAGLDSLTRNGIVRRGQERAVAAELHRRLQVKGDLSQPVATLSGGNQQKIVFAKWLLKGAKILLLVEPTRGVDVQAKAEIWKAIEALADSGTSVLVITSEVNDAVMCDRAIVLSDGRITARVVLEELESPHDKILELCS
ncbi:sugar ABC transporter ATP-binding protein [Pseudarthrobacter oxydans]|uniref:sugar ABC transporter ATP-binding protein n=1 Tax=Pseudarthrobacter oxydans TaxID=1671 RepID=UPI0034154AFB